MVRLLPAQVEAAKTIPLEVSPDHKHDRRGLISMARAEDPDSGGSGFSVMLGPAPSNDMQYTLFGWVYLPITWPPCAYLWEMNG